MDPALAALLGGCAGLVIGGVGVAAARVSQRSMSRDGDALEEPPVPRGVGDVLAVLRSVGVVLDPSDAVVNTSPPAVAYGLVRGERLVHPVLREMVREVRRDGVIREADLDLSRGPSGAGVTAMRVRVAPLGRHVLLLAEDHTHTRRVEEVRRDFVANVSHELKTPVGGIALLAEAIRGANDDPQAVSRFADRIQVESTRLGRLVQDIVEFSRLQTADTLHTPDRVLVCEVLREAMDRCRLAAEAGGTTVESTCEGDLVVFGDADLLVTAVTNLVTNAVNYSERGTRVRVVGRRVGDTVTVSVTDEGPGIPAAERDRVFERFYRVDPARSRETGGTGLGLAIVKHICHNHGGDVTLWSEEGTGSTFTISLPAAPAETSPSPIEPGGIPA